MYGSEIAENTFPEIFGMRFESRIDSNFLHANNLIGSLLVRELLWIDRNGVYSL